MKKMNLKIVMSAVVSTIILAGCGKSSGQVFTDPADAAAASQANAAVADPAATGDDVTIFDYDMTQYVTVGDYLTLSEYVESEIPDEMFQYYYVNFLNAVAQTVDPSLFVTDRAVVNGDIVNLDFCGKKDGVAFERGTQQGAILEIGSGKFIPGFEEGLVGVMPGEEVDLDLTFPEKYDSEDLAGQAVVFTCKVNGIVTIDAILESANNIREEGDPEIVTEDDLADYVRTQIIRSNAEEDKAGIKQDVMQSMHTVVNEKQPVPEELVKSYEAHSLSEINYMAEKYYQTDVDTLMASAGMTVDQYIEEFSKPQLLADAAYYVIAKENGLLQTEEEFQAELEEYITMSGLTREEFFESESEEWYRVLFLRDIVLEYISDRIMQQ